MNKINLKFYSRRESKNCINYKNIDEIPESEILFDFSQRANGEDVEQFGLSNMSNYINQAIKRCKYYVFVSTLSIDINNKIPKYPNEKYSKSKLFFEKHVLSNPYKHTYILRIPSCFNKTPKESSLIKLLFDRVNGDNSIIKQPEKSNWD